MPPTALRQRVPPKRILIAEDHPSVAESLQRILAFDDHSVQIAKDGSQALDMFGPDKHDLVITDFKMPIMDGLELAEAIKQRSPGTPIILITAYLELIKKTEGKVSNVDLLLSKPFSIVELQSALQKIFPTV